AGTFQEPRQVFTQQINVDNADVSGFWIDAYQTVNITNNVLSALEVVLPENQNSIEGQALFIRAALYFELVRFFARQYEAGANNSQLGVPLVLNPTSGELGADAFVSRADVESVYGQIVNDLEEARRILPSSSIGIEANAFSASALLARVYLQMGRYAEARDAADFVISSGAYQLLGNYADVFNRGVEPSTAGAQANSNEDIFALQVNAQDGTNVMNTYFSIPEFGGRDGDVEVTSLHLDLYDSTDTRRALFFESFGSVFSGKWNNPNGNVGVIRLAEMYLIRAETNQRLGTTIGASALDDYNLVHTRAGLEAATSISLEEILMERRRELAHEGFRIHDARRLGETINGEDPNGDAFIYPIPLRETEANANLVQNPGY
ncbi:MAG: RagB/SusD family nutrient uptake outer membrane protein, partial [Bacteroidota bacterium]